MNMQKLSKQIAPKLRADLEYGEGTVFFPVGFEREDHILQLDLLQDWIRELSGKYNGLLGQAA